MALPNGLLQSVKNYLDITWTLDDAGEEKLSGIVARGMKYLNETAGAELDFTTEDKPRELLMDYCRYVRSNALEEFMDNYLPELLSLQNACKVQLWAALESLSIGSATLTPTWNPLTLDYAAQTANESGIVLAAVMNHGAVIEMTVDGEVIENGAAVAWADGENTVAVTVTNGATTKVYTVTVTKGEVTPDEQDPDI